VLPDSVLVQLRPLLVPEPPRLLVQSNVIALARHVFVCALWLVKLFVHGVDLAFGVADVLLEHPDVLQEAVAVGAPLLSRRVAGGVWVEGHFGEVLIWRSRGNMCWGWCCLGFEKAVVEYKAVAEYVTDESGGIRTFRASDY